MSESSHIPFLLVLSIVLILAVSGCVQEQPALPSNGAGGIAKAETFTIDDVKAHANAGDCWLVISGKVYDVTEWIPFHPGGDAILEGCGKDATKLFETRPMGSGTPHSTRARNLLPNYYIGDLKSG